MKKIFVLSYLAISVLFIGCPSKGVLQLGSEQPPFDINTPEGLYKEGQYYLKHKDFDYALRSFSTLVEDFSDDTLADDAQFMVAEILSNPKNPNQDIESALEEYQNLLDDYPDSPFIKKAQKKVEQIEKKLEKSD
jgi:outer membrane protein assembly factor BamD (BamD/ComL family)